MAFRTLLDAGIHAAAGSDFSPGPFAPLMGIQGMVTRTGWDGTTWGANQRISVDEAIKVNTLNGAYASHEESIKGSITAGKLADFVVLADDPHTVTHGQDQGHPDRAHGRRRHDRVSGVASYDRYDGTTGTTGPWNELGSPTFWARRKEDDPRAGSSDRRT